MNDFSNKTLEKLLQENLELKAERDEAIAELTVQRNHWYEKHGEVQSELTKARELLASTSARLHSAHRNIDRLFELEPKHKVKLLTDALHTIVYAYKCIDNPAHQSAPAAKCAVCGASTVESCDEKGCGYLGAGNGAPAAKGEGDE